ncbi:MAG: class I tRNA ligase family protein, partial [Candidatus Gracilibacteria bacterium]|nr:class I tRNA ligase family protein [Candidatus Gracilibacteria bacterium]
ILMTTYMTGQVPFEKVYLHGLVRTRDGKKMSKSNPETCIDPLDIIPEFGADALRLSLFVGSTPGNDMRLYKEKIAGYRNFVNKLWNVARYILMSVEPSREYRFSATGKNGQLRRRGSTSSSMVPKPKTMADRWILSRLQHMIESTGKNIDEFRFSQAAEDLYAFTWNELADWYLEISKIQKRGDGKKAEQLASNTDEILVYVLRTLLKLWHPFTPFVTEELWTHVKTKGDQKLISESWPKLIKKLQNDKAEKAFDLVRESITTIRNLRAEYRVPPAKFVSAEIVSRKFQTMVDQNAEIIQALARVDSLTVKGGGKAPKNTVSQFLDGLAIHLPLTGLIDSQQEKDRVQKEISRLEVYMRGLEAKLKNKQFLKNAPADIVKAEQQRMETAQDSLQKCQEQLNQILGNVFILRHHHSTSPIDWSCSPTARKAWVLRKPEEKVLREFLSKPRNEQLKKGFKQQRLPSSTARKSEKGRNGTRNWRILSVPSFRAGARKTRSLFFSADS